MNPDRSGCLACELIDGVRPVPGGRIDRTAHWVVEHCIGPLGVGSLIVKPWRHVVHVADLRPAESAELGPLLQRVSAAVTSVLRPEQVYVCLWSHAAAVPGHIHFVVQPAMRADLDRYGTHGPGLQTAMFAADETPEPAGVDAVCAELRTVLAGSRS